MCIKRFYIPLILIVVMAACKPSLPSDIMSRGEMEDVLYDIHLSHYIPEDGHDTNARQAMENGALQHARTLQVLRDHGISEKEWEKNIDYYTRHAELLAEVYDNVIERMSEDALAMGVTVDGAMSNEDIAALDSTNIWEGAKNMALISYEPENVQTWKVTPKDSVLTKGETITLSFNAMYINAKALQKAFAQICLTLDNDSTIQTSTMITSSGTRTLNIVCPEERLIKKIDGMFMMQTRAITHQINSGATYNEQESLQQALMLNDIRLSHKAPLPSEPVKDEANAIRSDSLMTDSTKMKKP